MNRVSGFEAVKRLAEQGIDSRETWKAAFELLATLEDTQQNPDNEMICLLASLAIQASAESRGHEITKMVHTKYDLRLRRFYHSDVIPLDFHHFTKTNKRGFDAIPQEVLERVDSYQDIALPAMKAYLALEDYHGLIEAGA